MHVSLTPEAEQVINQQILSQEHENADDVINYALHQLGQQLTKVDEPYNEALAQAIEKGRKSGEKYGYFPLDMDKIRQRAYEKVKAAKSEADLVISPDILP